MKISKQLRKLKSAEKLSGNQKGVALVLVLTVMSLATIMIMSFFSLATSEHKASATYSQGLQAQQIAEQSVNMVIAQIRRATSDKEVAWASQPGAIRTWGINGDFVAGYKLYSDDLLVDRTDEVNFTDEDFDDTKNWVSASDEYVDLNEPVIRGDKVYFPVVDPLAKHIPAWPKKIGNEEDDKGVEGFDFNFQTDSGPRIVDSGPWSEKIEDLLTKAMSDKGVSGDIEHLALPVKWVYQLADGTMGTLQNGSFKPFKGSSKPSESNQFVARFAFWADDESTKLNLNTHAGGLSWDTPRAGGEADMDMAQYQPAQREWQRYPGHPATVHLSPALAPGVLDIVRNKTAMELIYSVVPRVVGGGSEAGTRKINMSEPKERDGLIADKNPLFPSVDEYVMAPDREPNFFPQADGRPAPPGEMQDIMERLRFFLTVSSRSPEITMFNTPRIGIWPVHEEDDDAHRTPFDKMIAFCSTVAGKEYFFKRANEDSQTYDYEQIPRNKELYEYLVNYTDQKIPGVGNKFSDKYSSFDRKQLITQIFDFIRSTNLHDDTLFQDDWMNAFQTSNTDDHVTFTNPRARNQALEELGQNGIHVGHGQVTPIRITYKGDTTQGFGRFYTLKDAAMQVICCAAGDGTFGGVAAGSIFGGWDVYGQSGRQDEDTSPAFSNIPPMHLEVESIDTAAERSSVIDTLAFDEFPKWIDEWMTANYDPAWKSYRGTDKWAEVKARIEPAFNPANWNYNLLYRLDDYPQYRGGEIVSHKVWREENPDRLKNFSDAQRLGPGETLQQAQFVFNLFTPSMGWVPISPDISIRIDMDENMYFGPNAGGRGHFLATHDPYGNSLASGEKGGVGVDERLWWYSNKRQTSWGDRHAGGTKPAGFFLSGEGGNLQGRYTPIDPGYSSNSGYNRYHWLTPPFVADDRCRFSGGTVDFTIYAGGDGNQNSASKVTGEEVQRVELEFPSFETPAPLLSGGSPGYINEFRKKEASPIPATSWWTLGFQGANPTYVAEGINAGEIAYGGGRIQGVNSRSGVQLFSGGDVVKSIGVLHGDPRLTAVRPTTTLGDEGEPDADGFRGRMGYFGPHFTYDSDDRMSHDMSFSTGGRYRGASSSALIPGQNYNGKAPTGIIGDPADYNAAAVNIYGDFDNAAGLLVDGPYINKPDEGNTHSLFRATDGSNPNAWDMRRDFGEFPYFVRDWQHEAGTPAYFSPNRIVNGPGMFGSMPSMAATNQPWQTLLFRPYVDNIDIVGEPIHPGWQDPKDHYLMDLFWMPVVEPYAISDSFSTAGKINLNYQLLPFRHVKRNTAMRGVLRSEFMLLIPTPTDGNRSFYTSNYKHGVGRGTGYHWRDRPNGGKLQRIRLRSVIVESTTLEQFQEKFDKGEIFKSASEICELHLIPQQSAVRQGITNPQYMVQTMDDVTVEQMQDGSYWQYHRAIGDNGRERPYANIYQRTTTKSNVFKVHYRGQVLKQGRRDTSSEYEKWDNELDSVVGEYRGSSIVERYLNPNDPNIPDYATATPGTADPIGDFYRFRVANTTRFAP
ncbi:MAG: Verru_Chthon cassette protein A [Verrucomicrobiales bacterium]|nr:Verru_Chthon cassette protein A [Verrucomicrobiales bacterium]